MPVLTEAMRFAIAAEPAFNSLREQANKLVQQSERFEHDMTETLQNITGREQHVYLPGYAVDKVMDGAARTIGGRITMLFQEDRCRVHPNVPNPRSTSEQITVEREEGVHWDMPQSFSSIRLTEWLETAYPADEATLAQLSRNYLKGLLFPDSPRWDGLVPLEQQSNGRSVVTFSISDMEPLLTSFRNWFCWRAADFNESLQLAGARIERRVKQPLGSGVDIQVFTDKGKLFLSSDATAELQVFLA